MPQPITLRLLTAEDDALQDFVATDAYQRTHDPRGFVVRLPNEPTPAKVRALGRKLSHQERDFFTTSDLDYKDVGIPAPLTAAFVAGLALGTYSAGRHKSDYKPHPLDGNGKATFEGFSKELQDLIKRELILAEVQKSIMYLVDAPANVKRPQWLAEHARRSAREHGYRVKVLGKAECEAEGLGALLGVNRGSEDEPQFIIMDYDGRSSGRSTGKARPVSPDPSSARPVSPAISPTTDQPSPPLGGQGGGGQGENTIAIIGKGITFDTGGVSIKPSSNLHLMKSDMGGAAAVFGLLEAAARLRLPVHLIGIVPSTDNSVDALSIKPSDVLTGHSGKTIEIIDTDAEGRLVMSDGLSYALKHYQPSVLMDIATLTGSAVRTLGYEAAAMMTGNDDLAAQFSAAGEATGERVWRLPHWDAYRSGLDSDVADIKNYSGKPVNGAIDAFKFLEFFTADHPAFIHFDIAGVALKQGPFAADRQATGFGLRLLLEWLERHA